MIVLSFNVRGLGGSLKRKKIKELVRSHRVDFLVVQETKMEVISESLCVSLWGYRDCDWVYLPSVGRSGGILSMWRKSEEKFIFSFIWEGFVGVCLDWGVHAKRWFVIIFIPNVNLVAKRRLWSTLVHLQNSLGIGGWCFVGDFNAVKEQEQI